MTLVAAIKIRNVPILLGDLIVSASNDINPHAYIPTLQDLNSILPREEYWPAVRGLRRKLAKINDWLVVGWSGSMIAATVVIKELSRHYKAKRANRKQLFAIFGGFDDLGDAECIIVGWLSDKEGIVSFSWESRTKKLTINNEPYIIGSGSLDFQEDLLEAAIYNGEDQTNVQAAIHGAIGYAGNILCNELTTGRSIQALYGGGVDIIYCNGQKFFQLDDVTYMFWEAKIQSGRVAELSLQPIFMKYYVDGDDLLIKTTRVQYIEGLNKGIVQGVELYGITPLHKDFNFDLSRHAEVTNKSKYYCNCVAALLPNKVVLFICLVIEDIEQNKYMYFDDFRDGHEYVETLAINDEVLETISSFIDSKVSEVCG